MSDLGRTQTDVVRDMQRKHADQIQRLSHDLELLLAREKGLKAERDEWFTVAKEAKQQLANALAEQQETSALCQAHANRCLELNREVDKLKADIETLLTAIEEASSEIERACNGST